MTRPNVRFNVRKLTPTVSVIDIHGEINSFAESALMNAYQEATGSGAQTVLLNFTGLEFMNSSGIGLLVTLLIRASRQKIQLNAYGLSDHYRQIFELTRLNEAVQTFETEEQALATSEQGVRK